MKYTVFFRRAFVLAATALVCLTVLAGCGKEGMPSPKKTSDKFTITGAGISVMQNCLVARGTVTGAVNTLEAVTLEVAPIQSYDDCPGCPFVAREHNAYSASDIQLDLTTGKFMLSYCPATEAPMYRWRLVGKSVYPGLPHATTTPQVVIMNK